MRKGKAAVTAFFEAFGSAMDVEEFTPRTFAANDTDVLTVVRCRAKSRATGKVMDMNLHHYFVFRGSKIAFYRGTEDTVQTVAVLRLDAEPTGLRLSGNRGAASLGSRKKLRRERRRAERDVAPVQTREEHRDLSVVCPLGQDRARANTSFNI